MNRACSKGELFSMKSWRGRWIASRDGKIFKKRGGRIRVEIIICRRWLPGSTGLAQTVNFRGITVILLIVRFYVGVLPSSGSTESLLHIFLWTTIFFFSLFFLFQSKKKYRWNFNKTIFLLLSSTILKGYQNIFFLEGRWKISLFVRIFSFNSKKKYYQLVYISV